MAEQEHSHAEVSSPQQSEANPISFIGFVLSLASTAAVHFGDVDNPVSGQKGKPDLIAARQMIDILSLIDEKTRGNLTAEERSVLEQVLYELRMRFVEVATAEKRIQP
ncbi:MAG: DUF1844 domain-containing protein [Bacteroidales bacterium]